MAEKKGIKWNLEKLKNHKGMLGKSHAKKARVAISRAQRDRKHQVQEGFQKGHKAIEGTEKTRFNKGQKPWNYGTRGQNVDKFKLRYRTYKSNAIRRWGKFEVTLDEFRSIVENECYFCFDKATGIDRKDNNLGYIKGNMLPACGICNHMKNNYSLENFIKKCQDIVDKNNNKK